MSLVVDQLTKVYGSQRAVDNLSFTLEKGQILGFLGPNGAGKSTTMKMISCYLSPTSGTASVCGHDINDAPLEVRKHIGYLPEHNPLYLDMYVKEYLLFVAGLHNIANRKERLEEVIDLTGLRKESGKLISALSKGYRQRVGLAQAIMHDPDILILDEPTSGLDMNQLVDIRQLIKDLGKEKIVILSTHIMQEVQALCDRVIIINNGKLIADDPIDQLQSRLSGEERILLEFSAPVSDLSFLKDIGGVSSIKADGNRVTAFVQSSDDLRPDIFKAVVSAGLTLIEMKKESASVEHIFQQLTKSTADA